MKTIEQLKRKAKNKFIEKIKIDPEYAPLTQFLTDADKWSYNNPIEYFALTKNRKEQNKDENKQ